MDIRDSLAEVLNEQGLFSNSFYPRFFESCPEAKPYFEGVDLDRQGILLSMALISLTDGYLHTLPTTISYLKYLGRDHQKWGIPSDLFPHFGEALVQTLKEHHGENWDNKLEQQWREGLRKTTELLLQGYHDEGLN